MELACPFCLTRAPLKAFLADAAARRALAQALRCRHAPVHLVLGYLDAFRPPKRSLSWGRAERLLAELADTMEKGAIRRHGRDWPVTGARWREGLSVVVHRHDAGELRSRLRDHAYLWEVLSGLSNRAEAAEERNVEAERRSRSRSGNGEARPAIDIARAGAEPDYAAMEERAREATRLGYSGPWDDRSVRAFLAGREAT